VFYSIKDTQSYLNNHRIRALERKQFLRKILRNILSTGFAAAKIFRGIDLKMNYSKNVLISRNSKLDVLALSLFSTVVLSRYRYFS